MHGWTVSNAHMNADQREANRQRGIYEELCKVEPGGLVIEGMLVSAEVSLETGEPTGFYTLASSGTAWISGVDKSGAYWILRHTSIYGALEAIRAYEA